MVVTFAYAARSDIGLTRANNQDSAYAGPHLLVVADGMGGHAGGDIASSVALAHLAPLDDEAVGADEAAEDLELALEAAHEELLDRVAEDPELAGLGTTITALLRSGDRLVLGHIGDSRAYLLREGQIEQVTADHTFVQYLVDTGKLAPEQAERHPQRSLLLRVLGDVELTGGLDISARKAEVGDRWLLCSDGLSSVVSATTISRTLTSISDPAACADALVELALRGGGPDNVTCIVADVVDPDAPGTTPPSAAVQVVGAAAIDRHRPTRGGGGAAGKAAGLGKPQQNGQAESYDLPKPKRWRRRLIVLAVILAFLGAVTGGLFAAYNWTQTQYYVAPDGEKVAIFQGIPQEIGPIKLSQVIERSEVYLDDLSQLWRDRFSQTFPVDNPQQGRETIDQAVAEAELGQDHSGPSPTRPATSPATPGG
ncbi:MAG: protein phosphatase 2C domain-containing protein [Micrococcales bacterium]|nr:protein phosphatase 2C domain-containing protein [Micrococcales bacterium]